LKKLARLGIAALSGAVAFTALAPTVATGGACWTFKAKEQAMAKKINSARSANGKVKLKLDPHLSRVARGHTRTMISKNSLYHTKNLGSKVTRWNSLGENVGYGFSVKNLHKMFMGSAGHRANILKGKYRYFGIATKKGNGWLWTTVIFESKKDPGTVLSMPNGC
jgi:uncharacterized protein YkwD